MVQLLSSYLKIGHKQFEENGIFDAVLGIDTRLFLDPFLLKKTKINEFKNSRKKIETYYSDIIRLLLEYRRSKNIRAWREALRRLTFKETSGVFIGYGVCSGDGNAIGVGLAKRLLTTAFDILDMGINDPEIFELIGLFEEDFGADRLSDMTIAIIKEEVFAYTEKVMRNLGVEHDLLIEWRFRERSYILPKHPTKRKPAVLLPKEFLRDLPVALSWEGIDHVVSTNRELRERLNRLIGETWKKKIKKRELRGFIFSNKANIEELIAAYRQNTGKHYDFDMDPAGEVKWYELGNTFARENPLPLQLVTRSLDDVENIVEKIVNQFKKLIEVNGLSKSLYVTGKPLHERFAQRLFFAVADTYCVVNNLDVSPEPNAGNGPVDFKFSYGYQARVLVEIKLTSSRRVIHGFNKQLPAYQDSEGTQRSFYVVLKTTKIDGQVKTLLRLQNQAIKGKKRVPNVIVINAWPQISASKK